MKLKQSKPKGYFSRMLNEDHHNPVYLRKTIEKLKYMFDHPQEIDFNCDFNSDSDSNCEDYCQFVYYLWNQGMFDSLVWTSFREFLKEGIYNMEDSEIDCIYDSIKYGNCCPVDPCYSNSDNNYYKNLSDEDPNDFFENNIIHKNNNDDEMLEVADNWYEYINSIVDDELIEDEDDDEDDDE